MDPKLLYWTGALANLGVILVCVGLGVRAIRQGEVRRHRRLMLSAAALVAVFLVSYLLKVALLGREDRSLWTRLDQVVLHVHELCVAAMLLGGAYAGFRAWRFRGRLGPAEVLPAEPLPGRIGHRRAGWIAVVGAGLSFATASGVLTGMYARVDAVPRARPGLDARRAADPARAARRPPPDGLRGRSLLPLLRGRGLSPEPILAEGCPYGRSLQSVPLGRFKLTHSLADGGSELQLEPDSLSRETRRRLRELGSIDRAGRSSSPSKVGTPDASRAM